MRQEIDACAPPPDRLLGLSVSCPPSAPSWTSSDASASNSSRSSRWTLRRRWPLADQTRLQVTRVLTLAAESALAEIDAALQRLEEGTYGTCERCAKPIPWERLEVLPMTGLCTPCQYIAESGRSPRSRNGRTRSGSGPGDRRLIMITNCIIVGLDDSAASRAAHRWAAAYAHATGKDLCAVHVLDWPIGLNTSAVKSGTRLRVPKQDVAEPYWRGMHRVFDDTSSPHGSVLQFAQGDVGDVLVRLSTHADLLVVGTREPVEAGRYLGRIGQPLLHQPRQLSGGHRSRTTAQPSTRPVRP